MTEHNFATSFSQDRGVGADVGEVVFNEQLFPLHMHLFFERTLQTNLVLKLSHENVVGELVGLLVFSKHLPELHKHLFFERALQNNLDLKSPQENTVGDLVGNDVGNWVGLRVGIVEHFFLNQRHLFFLQIERVLCDEHGIVVGSVKMTWTFACS